jgi:outer membrane protein insertion porin family
LPNSLGPLDSNGQPLGGNTLLSGTVALIVPTFLERYNLRTSVFLDGGNVFNSQTSAWQPANPISMNNVRYSYGVQVEWWVPVLNMPLVFSLAQPLHNQPSDRTMLFQFNIGGMF